MVENLESLDDLEEEDDNRTMALVAILGTALVAGAIAFLVRRRQEPAAPAEPVAAAVGAWERGRARFRDERVQATRDFVLEKVLPELKPALLGVLDDIRDMVDEGFRRVEKVIKAL